MNRMRIFREVGTLPVCFHELLYNLYLDIVETMANSDNVIRAGLTPKAKDVANLVRHFVQVGWCRGLEGLNKERT